MRLESCCDDTVDGDDGNCSGDYDACDLSGSDNNHRKRMDSGRRCRRFVQDNIGWDLRSRVMRSSMGTRIHHDGFDSWGVDKRKVVIGLIPESMAGTAWSERCLLRCHQLAWHPVWDTRSCW